MTTTNADNPKPYRTKLIEVGLPLEAINEASAQDKAIRNAHPSSLHLYWARRPLPAARAVIFSQIVDDPSSVPDEFPTAVEQAEERKRLYRIVEGLLAKDPAVLAAAVVEAKKEIERVVTRDIEGGLVDDESGAPLRFHDPFAGGGAIPFEARRLGLNAAASDLNPIAVMINHAMISVPRIFAGTAGAGAGQASRQRTGLVRFAADVERFGLEVIRRVEQAVSERRFGIDITPERVARQPELKSLLGSEVEPIAWIWARTVQSPAPGFHGRPTPLLTSFLLSAKAGKRVHLQMKVEGNDLRFTPCPGDPEDLKTAKMGTKTGHGANFWCVYSNTPIDGGYVKREAEAGRMSKMLVAIAAKGPKGRVYLEATDSDVAAAHLLRPTLDLGSVQGSTQYMGVLPYGMDEFEELFTDRQLHVLDVLRSAISAIRSEVESAAAAAGFLPGGESLEDGGSGAGAYADAVLLILTMVFGKQLDLANTLCGWEADAQCPRHLFGRQAIPMVWDFAESNVLGSSSGSWRTCLSGVVRALERSFAWVEAGPGVVKLVDARHQDLSQGAVVSTDPPYYDNVPYADLSDFFYGWSRDLLHERFPAMTRTLETPKSSELVAFAHRQGSKDEATSFFMTGMSDAVSRMLAQSRPGIPVTIYYAFKQGSGAKGVSQARAGWESFLEALIKAGAAVTATWPLRTENKSRMRGMNSNALASSILLSCRERSPGASSCTRADFVRELRRKIHASLAELKQAAIAPVDLRQAALGPGMGVFSKYAAVIESDGSPMTVNEALAAIQAEVDEALTEQDADYDPITRFAAVWFEQHGFTAGDYGTAQTLATAQNISVESVVEAGLLEAKAGKVRLLRIDELDADWEPETDDTPTVWEMTHHLCRRYDDGGERAAADLVRRLGHHAEAAQQLAFRLFLVCDTRKWSEDAQPYNRLGTAWNDLMRLALDPTAASRGLSRAEESAESEEESLYADD